MAYQIDIDTVKIPGQRKRYTWIVSKDTELIETGDSFYIFNAKRAARRAADRHAGGRSTSELHYTEDYDPTA
jgi:hypothetical protein